MACAKCGYEDKKEKIKFNIPLCEICSHFSPTEETTFNNYISEKINPESIESFRKQFQSKNNILGMEKKARQGKVVNRAAFGYELLNKELVINEEEKLIVQKIFLDFLNSETSLNNLAKNNGFSINGIKKILRNFTYLGKVKFAGQITQGNHESIISPEIFNKVQSKLEQRKIK